jgi:hypothetical protein
MKPKSEGKFMATTVAGEDFKAKEKKKSASIEKKWQPIIIIVVLLLP